MRASQLRPVLVGLLLIGGASGCFSRTPAAPPNAAQALDPALSSFLNRSGSYSADSAFISKAEEVVQRRCLAKQNLPFIVIPPPPPLPADEQVRRGAGQYYGVTGNQAADLARVSRSGLGASLAAQASTPEARAAEDRRLDPATYVPAAVAAKVNAAMLGPDSSQKTVRLPLGNVLSFNTQGCLAESHTEVWGTVEAFHQVSAGMDQYRNIVISRANSSQPVRQAAAAWSACMKDAGYDYTSPSEMVNSVAADYATHPGRPQTDEIKIAIAHVTCDYKVGLTSTIKTQTTLAGNTMKPEERGAILSFMELQVKALRRARELLSANASGQGPSG